MRLQQQSQEAEGSEDEPEAAASDEPEDSAYSRVLSGLTDGLTRHLNNQLKEACPQPPSQREAYRPQNRHRKKRCVNPAHEPAHVDAPDQQPSSPMRTDDSGHGTAQVSVVTRWPLDLHLFAERLTPISAGSPSANTYAQRPGRRGCG